jgi:hypothetical protein
LLRHRSRRRPRLMPNIPLSRRDPRRRYWGAVQHSRACLRHTATLLVLQGRHCKCYQSSTQIRACVTPRPCPCFSPRANAIPRRCPARLSMRMYGHKRTLMRASDVRACVRQRLANRPAWLHKALRSGLRLLVATRLLAHDRGRRGFRGRTCLVINATQHPCT